MKAFVLYPLVLCETLLALPLATAAAKEPAPPSNGRSGRRTTASTVSPHDRRQSSARKESGPVSGAATARQARSSAAPLNPKDEANTVRPEDEKAKAGQPPAVSSVQTHGVKRGETLEAIAARYDTTGAVLSALNGLESGEPIRPGQVLFVPRQEKTAATPAKPSSSVWRRYAKPPKQKGYLELSTHSARFSGLVVEKDGRVRVEAVRALNGLLGAGGKHPPLPERLIRLLVKVSDTFGGRPMHLVSGYRTASYYEDSRHRLSSAVDFALAEVPNAVLCEYLRELDDVGVGYYPNSSFVHLDVRNHSAYWVDYAGPGEPPRSTPYAPRSSAYAARDTPSARPSQSPNRKFLAELEALVKDTKQSIEQAGADSAAELPEPKQPTLEVPAAEPREERSHADGRLVGSARGSSVPVAL